jgi:hypothetical protein
MTEHTCILKNWYIQQEKLCGDIYGISSNPIYVNGIRIIKFINDNNIEIAFSHNIEKNGKILATSNTSIVLLGEMDSYQKLKERSTTWLQLKRLK